MIFQMGYGSKLPLIMTLESCHVYSFIALETLCAQLEKIMWTSDAEDILIETGLCKRGTANKGFASVGDYNQSMREPKLL